MLKFTKLLKFIKNIADMTKNYNNETEKMSVVINEQDTFPIENNINNDD